MKRYKLEELKYEKSIANLYNRLYHESPISKKYDLDFYNFARKYVKTKYKILDIGCGPASLWPYFKKIKNINLIGIDISPEMIKLAKKAYPKDKFIIGDLENLPFEDKTFDIVIVSSVLHHLPKTENSFKEIRRILKTYGKLIGREPQNNYFASKTNPWISGAINALGHMMQRRSRLKNRPEPKIHEYHHVFNINEFVQNLRNYFIVKKIESKYPFSSNFDYIKNNRQAKLILDTDTFLNNYNGNQFFYLAVKDGYGKKEILNYINNYLNELKKNKIPPSRFIKRFVWLTIKLDKILKNEEKY